MRGATTVAISALLAFGAVGCGSTGHSSTAASSPSTAQSSTASTGGTGGSQGSVGALSGEAQSAATGDIPDNQVFLTFTNPAAGYSMSYPEGWTRKGDGPDVTFSDKNNIVHIVVRSGPVPTVASVRLELTALQGQNQTLKFTPPHAVTLKSGPLIKATYSTESAPNAVTGRRVKLVVDRYELARGGRVATVDLGTPVGVDNVDAYRMMIESLRWV
jgi:hypothetical protein